MHHIQCQPEPAHRHIHRTPNHHRPPYNRYNRPTFNNNTQLHNNNTQRNRCKRPMHRPPWHHPIWAAHTIKRQRPLQPPIYRIPLTCPVSKMLTGRQCTAWACMFKLATATANINSTEKKKFKNETRQKQNFKVANTD